EIDNEYYEFQRLHGMGETLHRMVVSTKAHHCRCAHCGTWRCIGLSRALLEIVDGSLYQSIIDEIFPRGGARRSFSLRSRI
ncbi:hypothetical protein ACM258_18380, partial [Phaeobacter piscinae]|uniref:hypothetical protein n=1 Tax=Phaeobacter piscinae TaxID=1580596 RepID=UPI0039F675A2